MKKVLLFVALLCAITVTLVYHGKFPVHAASATVTLTATKQTIRGFGGMNHTTWISDLTDAQRTLAFGNGAGQIGMSILRMHVDESSSNWSKDVATAQRAIALGAIVFASPWNPPSNLCETVSGRKRLRYDAYGAYTDHLNSFTSYMKQNGVNLYAISIQNEPDYANDWTSWTSTEIVNYLKNNAGNLQTKVIAPESFQYIKSLSDPILNDSTALANMDILGAHLYGTALSNFPYPLFVQKGAGKELWMTEHYTDSTTDANSWPNALDVAYEIHNSMVEAQFNAYVWWYIRRSYGMITESGTVSKRGWCMAQYSKFIRPGYVRVDATKNPQTNVYVSAYKNDQNVVIVVVNRNTSAQSVSLAISGGTVGSLTKYTTSGSKNVNNDGTITGSGGNFTLSLDASSVTTFVGSLNGTVVTPTPVTVTPTPTKTVTPTPTRTATPVPGTPTASPRVTTTPVQTATSVPGTPTPTPSTGGIKVQFYNQSKTDPSNQLYLNFQLVNTGSSAVTLSNVKIRYWFTEDGTQSQTFYCDYSPVGSSNVTGTFVKMGTAKTGADTYVEVGFTSGAGSLGAGASTQAQCRVAKSDWSNYTQSNDYSFNSSASSYVDWTKVTGYVSGALAWGTEP